MSLGCCRLCHHWKQAFWCHHQQPPPFRSPNLREKTPFRFATLKNQVLLILESISTDCDFDAQLVFQRKARCFLPRQCPSLWLKIRDWWDVRSARKSWLINRTLPSIAPNQALKTRDSDIISGLFLVFVNHWKSVFWGRIQTLEGFGELSHSFWRKAS